MVPKLLILQNFRRRISTSGTPPPRVLTSLTSWCALPCWCDSRQSAASSLSSLQRLCRCFLHLDVGVAPGDLLKRRSGLGVVLPVRAEIADGVRPGKRIGGRDRPLHDALQLLAPWGSGKLLSLSCRRLYFWRAQGFLLPCPVGLGAASPCASKRSRFASTASRWDAAHRRRQSFVAAKYALPLQGVGDQQTPGRPDPLGLHRSAKQSEHGSSGSLPPLPAAVESLPRARTVCLHAASPRWVNRERKTHRLQPRGATGYTRAQ